MMGIRYSVFCYSCHTFLSVFIWLGVVNKFFKNNLLLVIFCFFILVAFNIGDPGNNIENL